MSTSTEPAVSIIVPIYNVERFLEQCLQSIADQTLDNIEVICVNDGSTDSSPEIIDQFAQSDSRFNAIHKKNEGYGKGVNTGIEIAKGSYIGIVEPDDYIAPTMFQTLFDAAERHDRPDVVKGSYWRICDADTPNEKIRPAYYLHKIKHVDEVFSLSEDAELLFHHPSIWSAIYRHDFLDEHRIRMMEIPGAGWVDNPFLMETLAQAQSIVYVDEPLYYYREFNNGSSSNVKDPSVIYNRWLDMDEIVKRLRITSPTILEGHYNRGCAYIMMLDEGFDTSDPSIKAAIDEMASRIDYNAVARSSKILRPYKNAYQSHVPFVERVKHRIERMRS